MTIYDKLCDYLSKEQIHYKQLNDHTLCFDFTIEGKFTHLTSFLFVNEDSYMVQTSLPIPLKEAGFPMVIDFFTRLNVTMEYGYFSLNKSNGLMSHIIKVDCADSFPSDAVINESIMTGIRLFGAYGVASALYYLLSGMLTPAQAMDFVAR